MTTTHTFQGLNADNKPSSRVLNPPGGSSSNIFGANDAQPQARNPARNNSDSSSQSFNYGAGQVQNTAATNKSRASRNGEDSFHSGFGNYRKSDEGIDKAGGNVSSPISWVQNPIAEQQKRNHAKPQYYYEDTHLNIFGETGTGRRKMFRSVKDTGDSFTRIFGESSTSESGITRETNSSNSTFPVSSVHSEMCTGTSGALSVTSSHSISSHPVSREEKLESDAASCPSSAHSLGKYAGAPRQGRRLRKFSDRGAFNPITGEPYEQPKPKPELQQQPANNASVTSTKTETGSAGTLETAESLSSDTISGQEQPQQAAEKPEPTSQDQPQPEKAAEPAVQPVQPQTARQAAAQNRNQSGIFGGPQEPQEHRSTRVSQPPGGRSTNLW